MPGSPEVRRDLLVIGIGSPLRGDDRVGLEVVRRLREALGPDLQAFETHEPDLVLAERIAQFGEVVIVDAMREDAAEPAPFRLLDMEPGVSPGLSGGFLSHVFDWRIILALARDIFGRCPRAWLLGISAVSFDFSEELTPRCARNAEEALVFLTLYCVKHGARE